MRPIRPKTYTYNDVISDDDPTRLVHATDALSDDVFQKLACQGESCVCQGQGWSSNILAEISWESVQHYRRELAPQIGVEDPSVPAFENLSDAVAPKKPGITLPATKPQRQVGFKIP